MRASVADRPGVHEVHRRMNAPTDAVWAVLADGWLYSSWVVGTARVRSVDLDWPAVGSRLHHSFGIWPLLIDDKTVVVDAEPGERLELTAHGWPAGEAEVRLDLVPADAGCLVRLTEDAVSGPGALVPLPVRQPLIAMRNTETLRRLAFLAEGGAVTGG